MMDENSQARRAQGRAPGDARRHGRERRGIGRAPPSATALPHDRIILSAKVSGVQDLIDVYRALAAALRLRAAPGSDRSRPGQQGNRRHHRRARAAAAGRHRRYHPRVAHAAAQRRPHRGSDRLPADSAIAGHPQLHAAGDRLPRLRPHHQHFLPGDGRPDPDLPARADAEVEREPSRHGSPTIRSPSVSSVRGSTP